MKAPSVNVNVKTGWILERLAREIQERVPNATINAAGWPPRRLSRHDIQYFLPAKDVRYVEAPSGACMVGYFTHGEERAKAYWNRFDVCLSMNEAYADLLRGLGAQDVRVIRPGTEPPPRPIRFGVVGRVYGKERKGAHLVQAAVAAGYDVTACSEPQRGKRPPCRITHPIEQRAEFYAGIDYLLVTSTEEGGPMPVLEALAHGVPVIAPDVGWCWEFPVIRYERGSWESLEAVLRQLTQPPTWEAWSKAHAEVFQSLAVKAAA